MLTAEKEACEALSLVGSEVEKLVLLNRPADHACLQGQIRHRRSSATEALSAHSKGGVISTHASDPAGAKALLQYLAASDAQAIFKDAGFEPHS